MKHFVMIESYYPIVQTFLCFVQIADDLGMNAWTEQCPCNDRSLTYKVTKSFVR